jgi:peptide/nickel transport system permease protein
MNGLATTRLIILGMLVLLFTAGPLLVPYNPLDQRREIADISPSATHWLGTDEYGRDVLSRFLAGGRWSILAGVSGTALVLVL